MNAAARIATFAGVIALGSGAAALAGAAIDPKGADESAQHGHMSGEKMSMTHTAADPVRGLAVADDDLRIELATKSLERGRQSELSYRIVGRDGKTVRDFEVQHEKRMHFIVVRRDLTGFQHLHPVEANDGTWSTGIRLDDAGSYRVFADFARGGESHTLAADVSVDGPADLSALPAPAPLAETADGYEVRLASDQATAGHEAQLGFTVTKGGRPVQVEEYLGAGGHLVALREGDLAFLHVHPEEHAAPSRITFMAEFPTPGRYRLFLQFKHDGKVHTAAFTQEVAR